MRIRNCLMTTVLLVGLFSLIMGGSMSSVALAQEKSAGVSQDDGWDQDTSQAVMAQHPNSVGQPGAVTDSQASQENSDKVKPAGGGNWWVWVVVGVLVFLMFLLLIGFIVVIFVMRSKASRQIEDTVRRVQDDARRTAEARNQSLVGEMENLRIMADKAKAQAAEASGDHAEIRGHKGTIVYNDAAMALILIDNKTGTSHTLAVEKTNERGIVVEWPKYRIGQGDECEVCVPGRSVGTVHCDVFANEEHKVFVFDHNSRNGTIIVRGGAEIKVTGQAELKDGDRLLLGDRRIVQEAQFYRVVIERIDFNHP